MEQLSHEKLDVYQCSIEFLGLAEKVIQKLPQGYAKLADQLHRAAFSIPLNIAEGVGKRTPKDKNKSFYVARGSAFECGAILDSFQTLGLIEAEKLSQGKALLVRIAAMLTKLTA